MPDPRVRVDDNLAQDAPVYLCQICVASTYRRGVWAGRSRVLNAQVDPQDVRSGCLQHGEARWQVDDARARAGAQLRRAHVDAQQGWRFIWPLRAFEPSNAVTPSAARSVPTSLPPLVPKVSVVEAIKEEGGEDAFDSPREIEAVLA